MFASRATKLFEHPIIGWMAGCPSSDDIIERKIKAFAKDEGGPRE
jgi:hypothetical protein